MEGDHRVWPPLPGPRHRRPSAPSPSPEESPSDQAPSDRTPPRADQPPPRGVPSPRPKTIRPPYQDDRRRAEQHWAESRAPRQQPPPAWGRRRAQDHAGEPGQGAEPGPFRGEGSRRRPHDDVPAWPQDEGPAWQQDGGPARRRSDDSDWGSSDGSGWARTEAQSSGRDGGGWGRAESQGSGRDGGGWGRAGTGGSGSDGDGGWDHDPARGRDEDAGRRRRHPLDLEPDREFWGDDDLDDDADDDEPSWKPRIRGAVRRSGAADDDLPPSAHLYRSPTAPRQHATRAQSGAGTAGTAKKVAAVLVALAAGTALVAAATSAALRFVAPQQETDRLSDTQAGVAATLPEGWRTDQVPPATGFTSAARDGAGAVVMARPLPGPIEDAKKTAAQAAQLYSRLLLKGDRVTVVDDRGTQDGYTRALRAEYRDVVNRPAFLRVMLVTREERPVLLVGLLHPEDQARRQALEAVMTSLR
ncbi:hypothetical protein [Nonomuraea sp. NPDC049309]|uniref:hypothetical protein n=1 Tax=Nonomuraea sp. NPDC049309 TaxID=3364350 RepID=UPI00370FAA99